MSLLSKIFQSFSVARPTVLSQYRSLHLNNIPTAWSSWLLPKAQISTMSTPTSTTVLKPAAKELADSFGTQPIRTKVRIHYRPNVYRRLKKHGLKTRMSTVNGLKMLWRRKLKGRWFLHT